MQGKATEEIKEKLSVEEVLRRYIEIKPAGRNFKAKCPFHNDKTPSLMISPERQSWYCFGCNVGGDIFSFVMRYENIEFYEALKMLAEQVGVELKRADPVEHRQFGVLYEINEAAKDFFKNKLRGNERVVEYLKERGLKGETAVDFEVGVAGEAWDEVTNYLLKKGFAVEDIVRAGLAVKNENRGSVFDRFRERIMFPIMNHSGKTVAFTGRIWPWSEMADKAGKYVNSPETSIFTKAKILYGFSKTKNKIREKNEAVVVEGQMDVLMAYQDGVKNVVAASGTALTEDHLLILSRYADQVTLFFDNDEAGSLAQDRAIEMAIRADLAVKVVKMAGEDNKDAADLVKTESGKLEEIITLARPAMEFYFDRYLKKNEGVTVLKKGIRAVLVKLRTIPSAVERDYWIKELSRRTGVSESALREEGGSLQAEREERRSERGDEGVRRERESVERFWQSLSRIDRLAQRLLSQELMKGEWGRVEEIKEYWPEKFNKILKALKMGRNVEEDERADKLKRFIEIKSGLEEEEDLEGLIKQIKIEGLKRKKNEYLERVREVEREGRAEEFDKILKELHKVSEELNGLSGE